MAGQVSVSGDVICLRHSGRVQRLRIVHIARIAIMLGVDERYGHQNTDQTYRDATRTRAGSGRVVRAGNIFRAGG